MVAGIISLLVSLAGIASVLLNAYMALTPVRKKEERDVRIQKDRLDLFATTSGPVSVRIDAILCASTGNGDAGSASGTAPTGSTVTDNRLRALGISVE